MIYLDNAATSYPKPESVYQALDQFARQSLANPGRAGHRMALGSEHALDEARNSLNKFFNGRGPERFIFAMNGTDALNMAMKGVLNAGDHVVTTDLEHNSVSRPLQAMADAGFITLTRVPADGQGIVQPDAIAAALTPATRLVAVTHASNVLGTIQPIQHIGELCRAKSDAIFFLVDAAQTAGVVPIDVQAQHIDLLAAPGHKSLYGPTGTGFLYVSPRVKLRPWREGGTGGDSSTPTQPKDYPYYLEGGTPNVLGLVGMTAGLKYALTQTPDKIRQHEVELCDRLREQLLEAGPFEFYGPTDPSLRVGTISLRLPMLPAPDLGGILDQAFDIAVRPGLHCSPYIHRSLGTFPEGTIRVSPGPFSTTDDIDQLAAALKEISHNLD